MWQYEGNDELQAYHTMRDISNSIDDNTFSGNATPLVIGMDANIPVIPNAKANPTGVGMHDSFEEKHVITGGGGMKCSKRHKMINVSSFQNLCDPLTIYVTNTCVEAKRPDAYTWERHRTKIENGDISQIDFLGVDHRVE